MAAGQDRIDIGLQPSAAVSSTLLGAIPLRQSTRGAFDGRPLSPAELDRLEQAGTGAGVHVALLTNRRIVEQVLALVVAGNGFQLRDPAFVRELKAWIRFGEREAIRSGDGLFARCSGNPALPRWLGNRLFDLFVTEGAENDRCARQVRSSAGLAVFVADRNDRAHWVEVGRAFERFALHATAMGVRTAHLNQPVEVPILRDELAGLLALGGRRPDLVVRFGRGPAMPASLRRPLAAVVTGDRAG